MVGPAGIRGICAVILCGSALAFLAVAQDSNAPPASNGRWTVQYFYDVDRSVLELTDLAFPSALRGVAIGTIYDKLEEKKPKYTALITSDGGTQWSLVPLKEFPRSIFFLDDSLGWMATTNGIWFTQESGRSWTKISEQPKPNKKLGEVPGGLILRLWFLDPQHGYGVGFQKSVFETHDGGHTWTPLDEAAAPTGNPVFTSYTRIAFADAQRGMIVGGATPPRRDDADQTLPAWMEPERAAKRRQVATLTLLLQTASGGEKWSFSTAPLIGFVNSVHIAANDGLAVFSYSDSFEWPSEVYRLNLATGKSTSVFREKNRLVTDTAIFPNGRAFLAAVEPPGRLHTSPIPGKVVMLTSSDFMNWSEMEVDYKAVARSLVIAGPDSDHLWAATDTGMILRLATPAVK